MEDDSSHPEIEYQVLPVQNKPWNMRSCDAKAIIGKTLVSLDTIPNGLLAFTLISNTFEELGWFRLIPATIGFVGTFYAVYNLFAPYVVSSLKGLSLNKEIFYPLGSQNKMLNYIAFIAIALLTLNATYVFSGMNLEGIDQAAKMSDELERDSAYGFDGFFNVLKIFFQSDFLKWPVTLLNIPVTLLAFSAVHKNFLINSPRKIVNNLIRDFEGADIHRKRKSLLMNLDQYEAKLKGQENLDADLNALATTNYNDEANFELQAMITNLSEFVEWQEQDTSKDIINLGLIYIWKLIVLGIFYLGTYCMEGNAKMTSKMLDIGDLNDNAASIMSFATRISITGIWYENAYDSFTDIVKFIFLNKGLAPRLDNNLTRASSFIISGISGFCSSLTLVHSVIIALELDDIELASFFGIVSIITAAFGPTIGDGTPTFKNRINSYNAEFEKNLNRENTSEVNRFHLFKIHQSLNKLRDKLEIASSEEISQVQYTKPLTRSV